MQAELTINPSSLAEPICRFILAKAEALKCTPGEAVGAALNELAESAGFPTPPPQPQAPPEGAK